MGQPATFVRQLRSRFLRRDAAGAADAALLDGYLDRRDEAAFAALVRRHGPMVWGVCRRVLGNAADAEDAFQATFLVLVRKAATVRPRAMVGNWLYGVACRTARDARRAAASRRAKEAAVVPRTPPPEADRADLRAALDEELERLPAKSRAVLVLSDLEGRTRAEVARQLGWPEGTVASRLGRARATLAGRLARHGLAVSAGSLGTLLAGEASAAVPAPLLAATVDAAGLLAAGPAAAALIPAPVVALTKGALRAMLLKKVLYGAALALVVGSLGTGTGLVLSPAGGTERPDRAGAPPDRRAVGRNGAPGGRRPRPGRGPRGRRGPGTRTVEGGLGMRRLRARRGGAHRRTGAGRHVERDPMVPRHDPGGPLAEPQLGTEGPADGGPGGLSATPRDDAAGDRPDLEIHPGAGLHAGRH